MEIVSHQGISKNVVRAPTIKCDCGFVFQSEDLDGEWDANTVVECPECHLKETFRANMQFIFDKI